MTHVVERQSIAALRVALSDMFKRPRVGPADEGRLHRQRTEDLVVDVVLRRAPAYMPNDLVKHAVAKVRVAVPRAGVRVKDAVPFDRLRESPARAIRVG